jgi:hypothetical protein
MSQEEVSDTQPQSIEEDSIQEESPPEQEAAPAEVEAQSADDATNNDDGNDDDRRLQSLYSIIGGDDADIDVSTVDKVDADTIRRLTPQGRSLMRRQRKLARAKEERLKQQLKAEQEAREAERAELEKEKLELRKARENYTKMFGNKDLREQIKRGMEVDPKTVDYTSPEGINKLIDRQVAERFKDFAEPAFKQAEQIERSARLAQIEEQFPQMKDAAFRSKVEAKLRERKKAGENIRGKMRETILMVDYESRQETKKQEREQRRKRARASAQHTTKSTTSAQKRVTGEIPREVVKKGGAAIARWLKANPKEAEAVLAAARR